MIEINWLAAIGGGVLIGCSATLLLLFNGRIAGISGIVASLVSTKPVKENLWQLLFIIGLFIGASLTILFSGDLKVDIQANRYLLVVSGLLVGFGTKLGSGCTSGHGVCGIARLSKRSIVATIVFILAAMLTVFIKQRLGL